MPRKPGEQQVVVRADLYARAQALTRSNPTFGVKGLVNQALEELLDRLEQEQACVPVRTGAYPAVPGTPCNRDKGIGEISLSESSRRLRLDSGSTVNTDPEGNRPAVGALADALQRRKARPPEPLSLPAQLRRLGTPTDRDLRTFDDFPLLLVAAGIDVVLEEAKEPLRKPYGYLWRVLVDGFGDPRPRARA